MAGKDIKTSAPPQVANAMSAAAIATNPAAVNAAVTTDEKTWTNLVAVFNETFRSNVVATFESSYDWWYVQNEVVRMGFKPLDTRRTINNTRVDVAHIEELCDGKWGRTVCMILHLNLPKSKRIYRHYMASFK